MELDFAELVRYANPFKNKIEMYKAILISGDFEDNTMTFEVKGQMTLKAGDYVILTKEEHNELTKA